jgi:transcriptional regulator with XRE-family HTH domain
MSTDSNAEERARRVARRLGLLFADIYPAGRGPWSHQEVAAECGVPVEDIARLCAGEPVDGDCFATRLDRLCRRVSPATGRPYSNREVGAAIGKSGQYIGNLRAGVNEPGLPVATELSRFFGVSVSYFVHGPIMLVAQHFRVPEAYLTAEEGSPTVREVEDSLRTLIALRDERVQRVLGRVVNRRWPGTGGAPRDGR